MDIAPFSGDISEKADVIVVGVGSDLKLGPHAQSIDTASGNAIKRLIDCGEIAGKVGEHTVILAPSGVAATHVIVVGFGGEPSNRTAFRACGTAVKAVTGKARDKIVFALDGSWSDAQQEAAVAGAVVASTGQDIYREQKKRIQPGSMFWAGFSEAACKRGGSIGESINLTRRLVNIPAGDMYPESFAEVALKVSEEQGLGIEIWDEAKLNAENCQALLSVARGSGRAPRLVILKHNGGSDDSVPLTLVGKGVTFDSGGLSIKTSDGMKTMKCDMAGAATVLGTMRAIAQLDLPVNVVGIMGLVENMIGPDSYKVGDVLKARSGRTIEVLNTDAEGRLVLADALNVAVEMKSQHIIDLATLTGACVVALGNDVAGVMTNSDPLSQQVISAAGVAGEYVWPLPMFPEFGDQIRSELADIKNIGEGRWGGAITAGKFLEEFVDDVPWVHIDIAGPSFSEKPKPWMDGGGTGVMVRTLVEVVRGFAK